MSKTTVGNRLVIKWATFKKDSSGRAIPFISVAQQYFKKPEMQQLSIHSRMLLLVITAYLDKELVLRRPSRARLRKLSGIGSDSTYEKAIKALIECRLLAKGTDPLDDNRLVLIPYPDEHELLDYWVANSRQSNLSESSRATTSSSKSGLSKSDDHKDSTSYYKGLEEDATHLNEDEVSSSLRWNENSEGEDAGHMPAHSRSSSLCSDQVPTEVPAQTNSKAGLEPAENRAETRQDGSEVTPSIPESDISSGLPLTERLDWYELSNEQRMLHNLREYDPENVVERSLIFAPQNAKAVLNSRIGVYPDTVGEALKAYEGNYWPMLYLKFKEMSAIVVYYYVSTAKRLQKPTTRLSLTHTRALCSLLTTLSSCQGLLEEVYDEGTVSFAETVFMFFGWLESVKVGKSWVWPMLPLFADEWRGSMMTNEP